MSETPATERTGATPHLREWWFAHVGETVPHLQVIDKVHEDAGWSAHYVFMTLMSAGIAVLGLLLSSPAVVIGAMLISPLMGPIIGLGFGLALFDAADIRRSAAALAIGIALAVTFCALVVLLSPLQTVTAEIAARTRPNLFDLLVALFSGLAGTYAMIRGRHGTIVGVAIATALMPPLAVVGFGLATGSWAVFWGAALLFLTNLMTIALSAAILARIYGFAGNLSPRQTGLQATLVVATFVALGVPLGLSLKQIAWEALASRQANAIISSHFGDRARMTDIAMDFAAEPVAVEATVLTPQQKPGAERAVEAQLARSLGIPVKVTIDQFRVGAEQDAAAAQLSGVRGSDRAAERLAERLALVAGVPVDEVLVDRANSRAFVRAAALPGGDLASYRALEQRVSAAEPRWRVVMVPPALALPEVEYREGQPTEGGRAALATAAWAAQRLNLEVAVSGSDAEAAAEALAAAGAAARVVDGAGGEGAVLRWLAPAE